MTAVGAFGSTGRGGSGRRGRERRHDRVEPPEVDLHLAVVAADPEAERHHGAGDDEGHPAAGDELLGDDARPGSRRRAGR